MLARNKLPWLRAFRSDLQTARDKGLLNGDQLAAHLAELDGLIEMDSGALEWTSGNLPARVRSVFRMRRASSAVRPMPSKFSYLLTVALCPWLAEVWEKLRARQD